jgi:hypothetical protein
MIRAGVKAVIAVLLRVPARKEIVVASVYTCYVDITHTQHTAFRGDQLRIPLVLERREVLCLPFRYHNRHSKRQWRVSV